MKKVHYALLLVLVVFAAAAVLGWQKYAAKKPLVQEKKVYTIGLLQFAPIVSQNMDGFKAGMEELGYREGVNVNYVYRDAQGDLNKVTEYAQELAVLKPNLIFVNTSPATKAIMKATEGTTIPVIFSMVADPIGAGFVQSVRSSGNNLSGTSCAYVEIAAKRLEVLHEVAPRAKKVLVFYRPEDLSAGPCTEKIIAKAPELGMEIIAHPISQKQDIEDYLRTVKAGDIDAIMDPGDSMVSSVMNTLVKYSTDLRIPYMALSKGEVEAGALAGYAVDYIDLGKQSSLIANQVLGGIAPTDIPFEQPRRWYFALNLQSAEKIGLTVPEDVIQKADFVIR
jgi:putative tryptophan/tyrosine transport system substrate-binding protein